VGVPTVPVTEGVDTAPGVPVALTTGVAALDVVDVVAVAGEEAAFAVAVAAWARVCGEHPAANGASSKIAQTAKSMADPRPVHSPVLLLLCIVRGNLAPIYRRVCRSIVPCPLAGAQGGYGRGEWVVTGRIWRALIGSLSVV
jgi:hypothetical protein